MEQISSKSQWCSQSKRRVSFTQTEQLYKFGVQFSQHKDNKEHIEFLDRARESLRKANSPILELVDIQKELQQNKLPELSRENPSHNCVNSTGFWKTSKKRPLIRLSDNMTSHRPNWRNMNSIVDTVFHKRDNALEKNIQLGNGKYVIKHSKTNSATINCNFKENSVLMGIQSIHNRSTGLSRQQYFTPKKLSKEVLQSIYEKSYITNSDQAENRSSMMPTHAPPSMKDLLLRLSNTDKTFYPKHTLMERNITRIQEQTKVSRYEVYNLFSAHKALLTDSNKSGSFDWKTFKKGLSIVLGIKHDFIEKVMVKNLGEIDIPFSRVSEFKEFLKFVVRVKSYNQQQKLSEFIDVLFDVRKVSATYKQVVAMFQQYKDPIESADHTNMLYEKLEKDLSDDLSKEELKELCISDSTVFSLLSRLIKENCSRTEEM